VVTRDEIIDAVWQGRFVSESAISARIAAARKAVGDDGKRQVVIRTVARRGLQMVARVSRGTAAADAQSYPHGATQAAAFESEVPASTQRIRYVRLPTGHSMAYTITGSGPPVILSGQGRSDLEAEWQLPFERHRFEMLARRNSLVRFDPIGTGQSDPSEDHMEIEQQAVDMGGLADALGLDRFAFYSQSGGCNAALCYAAENPDRISRLAMMGGYCDGRSLRDPDGSDRPEALRTMLEGGRSEQDNPFFEAVLFTYQPEGPLEAVRAYARIMQSSTSRDAELRHRDIINHHSSRPYLSRIACPTLILHSRHDAVHPLSEARKLAAGIPNAELVVLECANHIPWQGNGAYEGYLSTLSDFLAS
jgi:pimeloyl-ACP methyl ester carboxylesterase